MVYIFTGMVNDVVAWEMVRGLNAWTQLKAARCYWCLSS